MKRRSSTSVPRWLFYFAVACSWLFGAEIVVLTAAKRSLPGRLPSVAGWLFVAAIAVSVVAITRLEMTGRQRATELLEQLEEALDSITALTEASLSSLELTDMLDRFLERLVLVLHAEIGVIFLLSSNGAELEALSTRGIDPQFSEGLSVSVSDNDGLIGRVVVTESPIATSDLDDLEVLGKRTDQHLVSAAACPILIEGRLIGVCVAATSTSKEFNERELHLMQLVADRSGLGIERKRLDESERQARLDAERTRRHAVVLATASASLSAARTDFRPSLSSLVDMVVPNFSDWCAVDLVEENQVTERYAIRHVMDTSDLCTEELRKRVPLIDAMIARAIETGHTQQSPAFLASATAKGRNASTTTVTDPTPWISVPIVTGKGVIGALTFAFDGGESSANQHLVITADDIARRTAIAIDRVLFYQEAQQITEHSRRVAHQLQQLLGASLEVTRLVNSNDVISVIAGRALAICNASGAVVTVREDALSGKRAVAEVGKDVRVGNLEISAEGANLPALLDSLTDTTRVDGLLATPIADSSGVPNGSVAIWRTDGPDFSQEDETVLILLSQTASTALSSVELYRTIQRSEARWRTLIEAAPIGVMEVDMQGKVQWANRSALEIFGSKGAIQSDESTARVIDEAQVTQLERLWSRATTGAEVRDRELLGIEIGEEMKDLLVSVVPLYGTDHTVHGILTLAADISDRRRLEEELQQAQRMEAVGQLAGNVAHDFNNLLTLISGYTELLRAHETMDDRLLDLVNNIQGVTDRAALLTGRLLTISRSQSSRPQIFNLVKALDSMVEVLGKILGEGVEISHEFGDERDSVSIDPAYFDQMILNLAVNARDAMTEGGTFTISLHRQRITQTEATRLGVRPGEMFELIISDSGSGMDAETASQCFDPFFTTKGPTKGTGLGLAAVRSVIVESGGSIEVRSSLGVGTSFIIHLPIVPALPEEQPVVDELELREELTNATVLIAEDNDALRSMIVKVMKQAGFNVLNAPAGDLALKEAKSWTGTIELLITDVAMPGMNGPELARHIEEISPSTAILFISSNTAGIVVPTSRTGHVSFLPKPFRPSELVERVYAILEERSDMSAKGS
jgi:PAS domain S-box-containing protein